LLRRSILLLFAIVCSLNATAFTEDSCALVRGFYVSDVTSSSATLGWDGVAKSEGYQYVVSKSQVPPDKYGHFTREPGHKETGLGAGGTYYTHVRNKCSGAQMSKWVTVQFNTPALAKDLNVPVYTFAVQLYPSVSDRSVTIKIKDSGEDTALVTLYNILGDKIKDYTLTGDRLHIEVGSLPAAIYYVRYNDARGRIQMMRFTKM
jgi:hypothetical protein